MKRSRLSRRSRLRLSGRLTMADVRRLNAEKGQYFFSSDTMRFFRSRVESELIADKYFITSEQFSGDPMHGVSAGARRYTVRMFNSITGNINTLGAFQEFPSRRDAMNKIKELIG